MSCKAQIPKIGVIAIRASASSRPQNTYGATSCDISYSAQHQSVKMYDSDGIDKDWVSVRCICNLSIHLPSSSFITIYLLHPRSRWVFVVTCRRSPPIARVLERTLKCKDSGSHMATTCCAALRFLASPIRLQRIGGQSSSGPADRTIRRLDFLGLAAMPSLIATA